MDKQKTRPKAAKPANPRHAAESAARLIDARIKDLSDWRGKALACVRALIKKAGPEITEEWKWSVPVWSHAGIICTGETYKNAVKLTFAKGAAIPDPAGLFNSSLEGNTRRAIDIHENDHLDEAEFKALIRAAAKLNASTASATATVSPASRKKSAKSPPAPKSRPAKLLTGGNPQIAKADGDKPVQAYIAAMPGWKRDIGRRLDALVTRAVPAAGLRKAVKWNSPFYGIEGRGWFFAFHVFTHYVKVNFFNGASLRPVPPGGTGKDARWIDIHEDDLDERQMANWIEQSAALPGWGKN